MTASALVKAVQVPIGLQLHGQQRAAETANFTYHAPPFVSRIFPFSGPVADSIPITGKGGGWTAGDRRHVAGRA